MANVVIRVLAHRSGCEHANTTTVEINPPPEPEPEPVPDPPTRMTYGDPLRYHTETDGKLVTWPNVAATLVVVLGILGGIFTIAHFAAKSSVAHARTERFRLEVCGRNEDPEQRIICIHGLK